MVLQVDNETALFFEPVTWGMVLDGECPYSEILPTSPSKANSGIQTIMSIPICHASMRREGERQWVHGDSGQELGIRPSLTDPCTFCMLELAIELE